MTMSFIQQEEQVPQTMDLYLAEALLEATEILNRKLDTQQVLQGILDIIDRIVPHDAANISEIKAEGACMVSHRGYPSHFQPASTPLPLDTPSLQAMIDSKRPYRIPDVHADPRWIMKSKATWTRSYLGVPIQSDNQVVGFINLSSQTPHFFTSQHEQHLQMFANHVAIAMTNAHFYEQARAELEERKWFEEQLAQRNQELEALNAISRAVNSSLDLNEVLDQFLLHLQAFIPFDSASIALINQNRQLTFISGKGLPRDIVLDILNTELPEDSLSQEIMNTRKPIIVADVEQDARWFPIEGIDYIRSWMGIPLLNQDRVIGQLFIDNKLPDFYDEAHAQKALAVAQQVAIVIENAGLYEKHKHYMSQLEDMVDHNTVALQLEQQRLQVILDATGEGICYMEDYRIQYVNPALSHLIGYSNAELKDQDCMPMQSTFPDDRKWLERLNKSLSLHRIVRQEMQLKRKDGILRDTHITFTLIGSPNDLPLKSVAVVRDISEEKALAQKKARFLATAAHELRNPLASLRLRLYMIRRQPERLPDHLKVLDIKTEEVIQLVEELLDITRFEQGRIQLEKEPARYQEAIRDAIDQLQSAIQEKNIQFVSHLPEDSLVGLMDQSRITQSVHNLLANAINCTPEQGQITLGLTQAPDNSIYITVTDTGEGTAPEDLPDAVFEPFHRATIGDDKGSGLGLVLVKEITEAHGGSVSVESQYGEGSTFIIHLPSQQDDPSNSS